MLAESTTATSGALNTIDQIRDRYELPGPHVTATLRVPSPEAVDDDLTTRWRSLERELLGLGASRRSTGLLDELLGSMDRSKDRSGRTLLVTANDESAASAWIGHDLNASIHIGALPALVPALHQALPGRTSTIVAAIDRTGADIFLVDAIDIDLIRSVEAEDERVDGAASDGRSSARNQRHRELVWERNASLVARILDDEAVLRGADEVVFTGADGEVRLVEAEFAGGTVGSVVRLAGVDRHEPGTPERLRAAALDFRSARSRDLTDRALAELREELVRHRRAVAGSNQVHEAITEQRVATLFIDLDAGRHSHHVDATVRAALTHGVDIVTGTGFEVRDGVAAIIKMPAS